MLTPPCHQRHVDFVLGKGGQAGLQLVNYVRRKLTTDEPEEAKSLKKIWEDWEEAGREFRPEMDAVVEMLDGLRPEE